MELSSSSLASRGSQKTTTGSTSRSCRDSVESSSSSLWALSSLECSWHAEAEGRDRDRARAPWFYVEHRDRSRTAGLAQSRRLGHNGRRRIVKLECVAQRSAARGDRGSENPRRYLCDKSPARDPRQKSEVAPRRTLTVWVSVHYRRFRSPNFRLIKRR